MACKSTPIHVDMRTLHRCVVTLLLAQFNCWSTPQDPEYLTEENSSCFSFRQWDDTDYQLDICHP